MFIIAFDPGQTTGIATFNSDVDEGEFKFRTTHLGPAIHHMALRDFISRSPLPNVVIYEQFDSRGGIVELVSREYIGIIREVCQRYIISHKAQPAALGQPSTFWNDTVLSQLGLWKSVVHERDATRHLLHYLRKTGHPIIKQMLLVLKESEGRHPGPEQE